MRKWVYLIFGTPLWVILMSCLLKMRRVFKLMEEDYERRALPKEESKVIPSNKSER